jgi:hypothetical protein
MELSAPMAFSIPAKQSFYQRLLETIQAIPDVEDAGIIGELFKANNREQVVTVERETERCPSACSSLARRSARLSSKP